MNGAFCGNCDGGFRGELVSEYLPFPFSETIRSARDAELIEFEEFEYLSKCPY
jgi:hypothetical protein